MNKEYNEYREDQILICKKQKTDYSPPDKIMKLGISLNVKEGILPLNGLRHPIEGTSSGWYIWAGEELSSAEDFFVPIHIEHITDWCPEVIKFLALPPGWRFLTDGEYVDVWYDSSLLLI